MGGDWEDRPCRIRSTVVRRTRLASFCVKSISDPTADASAVDRWWCWRGRRRCRKNFPSQRWRCMRVCVCVCVCVCAWPSFPTGGVCGSWKFRSAVSRQFAYKSAVIACLPTLAGWSDRLEDSYRLNLSVSVSVSLPPFVCLSLAVGCFVYDIHAIIDLYILCYNPNSTDDRSPLSIHFVDNGNHNVALSNFQAISSLTQRLDHTICTCRLHLYLCSRFKVQTHWKVSFESRSSSNSALECKFSTVNGAISKVSRFRK